MAQRAERQHRAHLSVARGISRRGAVPVARIALGACALGFAISLHAAPASYRVDLEAPRSVRSLLKQHLDLIRFAKRQDIGADQFEFLVTAAPEQARELMATAGYFSPQIHTKSGEKEGRPTVTVTVDPGPQTHVSAVDVEFTGPVLQEDPKQAEAAREGFSLKAGDAFTQSGWDTAKSAALRGLQTRRYLGAKIVASEARIDPRTEQAQLKVTYDSGPTFTLGPLTVDGAKRYPERIAHNVNPLHVGEIYDRTRITELQRQLQNTPYYASVAIDVNNDANHPQLTPLHVKLSEYPYNNFRGAVGYSTDTGPHVQGSYSYLNTFGAAWPFTVSGRVDQKQQYGQVQLAMPPDSRGWTNSVLASYSGTELSGTRIYSGKAGIQRTRTGQNIDYTYSLMYYDDRLYQNAVGPIHAQALVPGWAWTRRNVDDPLFPHQGNLIHAEFGFAVKGLATDQSFVRAYARGQQYVPLGRDDLFVFRAELGAVMTGGSTSGIPASLLFRAGGSNSIRGYSYQGLGNTVDGSVLPTKYLATGSAEYQHWLNRDWGAATFFDLGTATDTRGQKIVYPGVGVGARWRSPVGPVNLDVAYGLRNRSVRPYLTLGIAF